MLGLFYDYPLVSILVTLISAFSSFKITSKIYLILNRHLIDNKGKITYKKRFNNLLTKIIKELQSEENSKFSNFYNKKKIYVKQSGYYSEFAPILYLFIQYLLPVILFLLMIFVGRTEFTRSILMSVVIFIYFKLFMHSKRKEIENQYRKYAYRIYRYIHNMLDSGVDINNTITSLYLVGINSKLEKPLYDLSATYGLTKNIQKATTVFNEYFKLSEVESFCITLKHGIEVGDIKDLIARQEKTMFRQYFNYVKWETDSCDMKTTIIIILLSGIICTLILIPMLGDAGKAIQNIFQI